MPINDITVSAKDANNAAITLRAGQNSGDGSLAFKCIPEIGGAMVTAANPLPTYSAAVTPTPASTTSITAGGAAQPLFTAGSITNGFRVVNPTTASEYLYIDDTGASASATGAGSIPIPPGYLYQSPFPISTGVSIYGATTGHAFGAVRY